jgi:hypothetical protein
VVLKNMTLLSEADYYKYRHLIPAINAFWWLKDAAPDDISRVRMVNTHGGDVLNIHYGLKDVAIRPCCVFEPEISDPFYWKKLKSLIGSKIRYGRYDWVILDVVSDRLFAICDTFVLQDVFGIDSNRWEDSEIKKWFDTKGEEIIM